MNYEEKLKEIIYDTEIIKYLEAIQKADIPGAWLVAGAIRNTVWKYLYPKCSLEVNDIDIIHFSPKLDAEMNKVFVERLTEIYPEGKWDCANQFLIYNQKKETAYHMPNGPYNSIQESMLDFWFTVNTIALRLDENDEIEIMNPEALEDLFNGVLRVMEFQKENKQKWFENKITKITSRCSKIKLIR